MIRGLLNIALYTISVCSVALASSSSSSIISRRHALQSLTSVVVQHHHHRSGRLRRMPGDDDTININSLVFHLRGGEQQQQQDDTNDDSYHGNYIFPPDTETAPPPSSTQAATSNAGATTIATTTGVDTTATVVSPPPTLAIATSTNSKLSNLQERTGPALLMLGAIYLLLKYTGKTGLIGLVFVMQCAMYAESTLVVESYYHNHPTATTTTTTTTSTSNMEGGGGEEEMEFISFQLHKWWWFATAIMLTSGRKLLSEYTTTGTVVITMDQWNLITFGMVAVSLVGTVIQLAMVSSIATKAEEVYRQFIRKMACCHVSLLLLVGMSSFWIRTVEEYGLVWVLFPALLVVVNDTMAYVFGVLLGKHKLLPRLSPKKTVEGFVGAGMSTLAVAAPLLQRMMMSMTTSTDDGAGGQTLRQHALMMALYISLISPFGGFLASAVKRAHGAKDFGSLIPGHGGVVDRFDCQVVTAPFVYLYLKTSCST